MCVDSWCRSCLDSFFFFFNDTATTEIYTLSLHDALPISFASFVARTWCAPKPRASSALLALDVNAVTRSEEHTSELQSQFHLVCRLLLEKKKKKEVTTHPKKNNQKTSLQ